MSNWTKTLHDLLAKHTERENAYIIGEIDITFTIF